MRLVRKLQKTYRMEPAGSQGVWSLDDYQFVPFIWGAAQFIGDPRIKPKAIPDYERAALLAEDYHFFACIQYISEVKTGPFAEHSNQLWNVSGVPTWEKVYQGLIKMYRAEVLSKFPVIQHVFFGSLFTLKPSENPLPEVPASAMRSAGPPPPPTMMGVMPAIRPGATSSSSLPHKPTAFPRPPPPPPANVMSTFPRPTNNSAN